MLGTERIESSYLMNITFQLPKTINFIKMCDNGGWSHIVNFVILIELYTLKKDCKLMLLFYHHKTNGWGSGR